MSPFEIRRERFSEFCLLVKRLYKHNEKEQQNPTPKKNGKQKQYIPVTDYKPIKKEVD